MTVQTTSTKSQALGNGVTTDFPFDFELPDAKYMTVTSTVIATGVDTKLTLNTDYTIPASSLDNPNGGTVKMTTAPADGTRITMRMVLPMTQLTDLRNQGDFQAETHEDVFDRLARVDQQQQEQLDRAFALVPTAASGVSLVIPAPVAGRTFKWNAAGNGLVTSDRDPDTAANEAANSAAAAKTSEDNAKTSETNSKTSETNAKTSETNAANSAASTNLPTIAAGDANKTLRLKADESGYELVTVAAQRVKNVLINSNFDVWDYATSQTTDGYGSDNRWANKHSGSTKTHSQQSFTLGQTEVPHNPKFFSRTVVSSVAGTSNFAVKIQRIEDVRSLAGKKIAFSFYAKADAARNMAIELRQDFGTGGTPSTHVTGIGAQLVPLTTGFAKRTFIIDVPSIAGKTLGTNGDHYLEVNFWFDAGSDLNTRTASLGQQSGTFDIAQVELVEGSVSLGLPPIPKEIDEIRCKRFAKRVTLALPLPRANQGATDRNSGSYQHDPEMRAAPSVSLASGGWVYEGHHDVAPTITNSKWATRFEYFGTEFRVNGGVLHADVLFSSEL